MVPPGRARPRRPRPGRPADWGITELRTGISWADCGTPEGEAWYAWLFPQLARTVNVLPCFVDTPPLWGASPKTGAPPGNLKSYADFAAEHNRPHRPARHDPEAARRAAGVRKGAWRPGDQRYYVSDISKMFAATRWSPKVGVRDVIPRLYDWLRDARVKRRRLAAAATPGRHAWDAAATKTSEPARPRTRPSRKEPR